MPEHYEPTRREHLVMAAYGLGNAIAGACGKIHARRRVVGRWLAALACVFSGWHARGQLLSGAYELGPTHVQAASEPSGGAGELVAASAAQPFGNAEVLATPTADPRLQPDYVDPSAPSPAGEPLPAWLPATVTRWEPNIRTAAGMYAVDPALVAIIVTVESAGNPLAGSGAGALGLMQVVPRWHPTIDDGPGPHDPDHNLDVGTAFLADLLRTYAVAGDDANDWQATVERAAAAFNGGPGGVTNPVAETRSYIRWIGGMWSERHDATSATFDAWRAAGGQVALDIAETVDGPAISGEQEAMGR